jgi:transcription initiation factor IIE alpha subunit
MLKNKVKGIFKTLQGETISSEYIAKLTNTNIAKIEKILVILEKEKFIK